jgi:hypothetical protein
MAGYSGTPLAKKLGLKPGFRVVVVNQPPDYEEKLGVLPDGVEIRKRLGKGLDFVHFFTARRRVLMRKFPSLARSLAPSGMLWIFWPKAASGMKSDLNGNVVREIGLESGLVDIKVCAVDDVWSGLKFVIRVRDRP